MKTSIFNSVRIIDIHDNQSDVINRTITSKYKIIIQEVRDCMQLGYSKDEAVSFSLKEFAFLIESDEDKEILLSWFNNSYGVNQKKVA